MSSFAVAHLRSTTMGPGIADYLNRIDATLESFGGRFVVHGSGVEVLEGSWHGDIVIIEFPDHDQAKAWYMSLGYQQIVALRTSNSDGSVIIVDRVTDPHHATDILRYS